MVDDDTRMIWGGVPGCFCPLHLEAFAKRTGRVWTREEVAKMLASGGDLFIVDRAKDFSQVMKTCMELNLIPKRITFVHPFSDREATLFLLSAKKGGKMTGTVITPPLILRDENREYTPQLKKIYSEDT